MRTTATENIRELKKIPPRKRRYKSVAKRTTKPKKEKKIGFWQGFFILLKFMDNAICHGITGIGIWLMLDKLGIITAIYYHYIGRGGAQ